jgi:hypothetical protein
MFSNVSYCQFGAFSDIYKLRKGAFFDNLKYKKGAFSIVFNCQFGAFSITKKADSLKACSNLLPRIDISPKIALQH